MREALDPWVFVHATYAIGVAATAGLVLWSWLAMRAAERTRDRGRDRALPIGEGSER